MLTFMQVLAQDSTLRDAYVLLLDGLIAGENSLDRVSPSAPVDYQRGKVAVLRKIRSDVLKLENPTEKEKSTDEHLQP